jgi:hypothetical protein
MPHLRNLHFVHLYFPININCSRNTTNVAKCMSINARDVMFVEETKNCGTLHFHAKGL